MEKGDNGGRQTREKKSSEPPDGEDHHPTSHPSTHPQSSRALPFASRPPGSKSGARARLVLSGGFVWIVTMEMLPSKFSRDQGFRRGSKCWVWGMVVGWAAKSDKRVEGGERGGVRGREACLASNRRWKQKVHWTMQSRDLINGARQRRCTWVNEGKGSVFACLHLLRSFAHRVPPSLDKVEARPGARA